MRHTEKWQRGCEEHQKYIMPSTYTVCIALWIPFSMEKSNTPLAGYSDAGTCFKWMEEEKCNGKLAWHPSPICIKGEEHYDFNNLGYCL